MTLRKERVFLLLKPSLHLVDGVQANNIDRHLLDLMEHSNTLFAFLIDSGINQNRLNRNETEAWSCRS